MACGEGTSTPMLMLTFRCEKAHKQERTSPLGMSSPVL